MSANRLLALRGIDIDLGSADIGRIECDARDEIDDRPLAVLVDDGEGEHNLIALVLPEEEAHRRRAVQEKVVVVARRTGRKAKAIVRPVARRKRVILIKPIRAILLNGEELAEVELAGRNLQNIGSERVVHRAELTRVVLLPIETD